MAPGAAPRKRPQKDGRGAGNENSHNASKHSTVRYCLLCRTLAGSDSGHDEPAVRGARACSSVDGLRSGISVYSRSSLPEGRKGAARNRDKDNHSDRHKRLPAGPSAVSLSGQGALKKTLHLGPLRRDPCRKLQKADRRKPSRTDCLRSGTRRPGPSPVHRGDNRDIQRGDAHSQKHYVQRCATRIVVSRPKLRQRAVFVRPAFFSRVRPDRGPESRHLHGLLHHRNAALRRRRSH